MPSSFLWTSAMIDWVFLKSTGGCFSLLCLICFGCVAMLYAPDHVGWEKSYHDLLNAVLSQIAGYIFDHTHPATKPTISPRNTKSINPEKPFADSQLEIPNRPNAR